MRSGRGRRLSAHELDAVRAIPLLEALRRVQAHVSVDRDFRPSKNFSTRRWFVTVGATTYELLVTGEKWFDTRCSSGGGGAIDLVMHLLGLDFSGAVGALRALEKDGGLHSSGENGVGEGDAR